MQTQINLLQASIEQNDMDKEEAAMTEETKVQSKPSFFTRLFGRS